MSSEDANTDTKSADELRATEPFIKRIALVFDFDETLAPDSFAALLKHCGYEKEQFEEERVQPLLDDGWDKKLARFYALIQESRRRDDLTITAETMAEVGRNLELYPEVTELFGRLTEHAQSIVPDIEVEFYLLTAGMLEIPRATPIADEFRTLWGGELHFDEENGELAFVKHIVTYSDKIRYLLKLCKGMNIDDTKIRQDVYRDVPLEDWHIPLEQVIYVGDGASDMPVFAYLADNDGLAIGVFKSDGVGGWEGYDDIHDKRRVQNLAPANYNADSELMQSLELAVDSICKRIALREKGKGE